MTDKNAVSQDQRRHPRRPMGTTVDFRLAGAGAPRCSGTIADLSRGGMTFRTDAPLKEGMTLHLALSRGIEIRGEVLNVRGSIGGQRRCGVRFHKIGYVRTN